MNYVSDADRLIPAADHKSSLKYKAGDTGNIMQVVLDCYRKKNGQLKRFAPTLHGRNVYETCSNIWHFVKENIRYKEDPPGQQWVKEPARVWADKVCDCKSYSIFIASALRHNGINGFFRFVSFSDSIEPTHVYIVVPDNGRLIKIDCVLPRFDTEKPFEHNYDYPMTRIYSLSGIGSTAFSSDKEEIDYKSKAIQNLVAQRYVEAQENGGYLSAERDRQYQQAMYNVFEEGPMPAARIGTTAQGATQYIQTAANSTGNGGFSSQAAQALMATSNPVSAAQYFMQHPDGGPFGGVSNVKTAFQLFSAAGVSPSFFSTFSFLKFLDNSEHQWKSRLATMKSWDANKRIAWYIDRLTNGGGDEQDAIQYSEMFGTRHEQIDDTASVDFNLAARFNQIVLQKFLGGNPNNTMGFWKLPGNTILCDLSKAVNRPTLSPEEIEAVTKATEEQPDQDDTQTNNKKKTLTYLGLGAAALFMLVK